MLVVTRKPQEGLIIGDNIHVTVIDANKDRVKLGIEAPPDVKIIRNELYYTEKLNVQAAMRKIPLDLVSMMVSSTAKPDGGAASDK